MKGKGADLALVAAQYKGPPTPTGACTATYRTVSSWSGGFQGEITVSAGTSAINGWTTSWATGGQTISQLWNGTLSATASSATVKNASWNGMLGAGGSTTFGFLATGSPSSPVNDFDHL